MPLQHDGVTRVPMINGVSYRCSDPKGNIVAVQVSHEALRDYGEVRALAKGSDKFDAGKLNGTVISVQTTDFEK